MILESIVTSADLSGHVNVAPMGPEVDGLPGAESAGEAIFTLRPFESSRTYQNLIATGKAVIHVTDDVGLIARAAVGKLDTNDHSDLVCQVEQTSWWRLKDCHRWFAVTVESIKGDGPRFEMRCRVEHSGIVRPFFGFNRAKHAVLEAAILATRTHLLSRETIDRQIEQLQPLIDKTAGPAEHDAFEFLRKTIDERFAEQR